MAARVAVVDPYSSGALLAPAFAARGHESVAVQSSSDIPELFHSSFNRDDFVAIVQADGDVSATAAELARLGIAHVLAGSEPGVELADELSERLGLVANDRELRAARRDKYLMAEAVRSRGLRTPAQHRSADLDELLSWARRRNAWPVIAKPPRSVASDSVAVCRTEAELGRAYEAIVGRRNVLGLPNDSVLVQELVEGPEYVVDTVSFRGQHRVAAFWRYHDATPGLRPGAFYEAMELLPYEGERQRELLAYTIRALDALGIRYGPAHTELIWDDDGPVLIEIGARLSAGNNAVLSRLCGGPCALDLTIEACVEPDRFTAAASPPRLTNVAMNCFLIPLEGHRLRARPPLAGIRRLASFHSLSIARPPRRRPVVGVVTLIHRLRPVVHDDLRRLRHLERTRFYEPSAVPLGSS
jgi:biotin carboxylase